jgi:hypothetical protein
MAQARAVFTLSDRNSSDAILDILDDRAHFALTRRGATQEEQAALEKDMFGSLGHPQNSMVLAWQDLYLYSQPGNPNRFITMSQLVAMLRGKAHGFGHLPQASNTRCFWQGKRIKLWRCSSSCGFLIWPNRCHPRA